MTTFHDHIEAWEARVAQLNDPDTGVCQQCVPDHHLWASVVDAGHWGTCDFCLEEGHVVGFGDLRPAVEDVLNELYVSADESGAYHDEGRWSETVEDVEVILEFLLGDAVQSDVLAPLVAFIASGNAVEYGFVLRRDLWGTLYDSDEGSWRNFMTRARGGDAAGAAADGHVLDQFPKDVRALLGRIERVAQLEGLFAHATPELWRCRPGGPESNFTTGIELGSAPAASAASGRLNLKGQSVFYGSTTLRGAVIEMENHHGVDVDLWAGQFVPSRALYHLDVMEPPLPPSPFAPGAADTYDALSFLDRFAQTLREPKSEDPRHYLPTQAFAAFLLAAHEDLRIDAIRYSSSLDPTSENWVVFAEHDRCRDMDDALQPAEDEVYMLLNRETAHFVPVRNKPRDDEEGSFEVAPTRPSEE